MHNSTTAQQHNSKQVLLLYVMAIMSCVFNLETKAQSSQVETHYYYIEEASHDLLKPINRTNKQDGTLSLEFSDEDLTAFFEGFSILSYVREFEWSTDPKYHKYYLIGLDSDDKTQELRASNSIVFSEYIGTMEIETLGTPNDYFDHINLPFFWQANPTGHAAVPNPKGYEHLELVNARRAWNITTGNSNIAIGIRDTQFYNSHPDVDDKITASEVSSETTNPDYTHGLSVSGAAAAETNNGFGISAIGYDSSIIPIQNNTVASDVLFLAQNYPEVKVVNISLGTSTSDVISNIYQDVWENYGVTVVAAAGNGQFQSGTNPNNYFYPASEEHTISVSSVGSYNKYGNVDADGKMNDWKDVHELSIGYPNYTHQHNDKVDIVAPGYSVAIPTKFSGYRLSWGTSYAAPMVAGTVALMHNVYPNIHPDDVLTILQETADDKIYDIPENAPYNGLLGAGRLNAYGAVLKAQCEYNNNPVGLDLNMQNTKDDFGDEPDVDSDVIWNSPDIWVRNQPDGFLYKESEDLHFVDSNTPVYVYVRVTNDSCHSSSGTEQLELYWAKGGLNQTWPIVWDGSSNPMDAPNGSGQQFDIGNQVGVQTIPVIDTGKYEIVEFQWFPEDPDSYENAGFEKPWMFCFLSRIVTPDDPMTFAEGSNAATNTRNNNNIAYHNATVINVNQPDNQGSVFAGNIGGEDAITTNIEFFTNAPNDDNIWQDAEVRIELNEDLWALWQDSGAHSDSIRVLDPNRRQIMVMSNHASLNAIDMAPDEWGIATVGINFLIHEVDGQEEYNLHVQQLYTDTQESLGGFSFTFNRDNQRQEFDAETSSTENNDGSETFYAQNINEGAKYNWYDEDGVLVYSGSDFTVSNLVAKEYKLEVIADYDNHIDYKTVETEDKRQIEYLSPNPATTSLDIGYKIAENDNAYIMLTHSNTGLSYNYVINSNNSNQLIPVDQLPQGNYIVNLIANGEILDTKNLIIN